MNDFVNRVIANFKDVVLNKYCYFYGRADRAEYWMFVLATLLIGLAFGILSAVFAKVAFVAPLLSTVQLLVELALMLPGIAVCIRRLNDVGKSWPWIFINLIPIIGFIWYIVLMATPTKE